MCDSGWDEKISLEAEGENAMPLFRAMSEAILKNEDIGRIKIEVESDESLTLLDSVEDKFKTGPPICNGGSIDFDTDSQAFKLAQCMVSEGWKNTGEIKRGVREKREISEDRLSQVLWDLSERGVLEKRPCVSDGRMKEYRITKMGAESVEKSAV